MHSLKFWYRSFVSNLEIVRFWYFFCSSGSGLNESKDVIALFCRKYLSCLSSVFAGRSGNFLAGKLDNGTLKMLGGIVGCDVPPGNFTNRGSSLQCLSQITMEVELLWRRPNAQLVALRGGLRLLRLAEFVRYNRAAIGGPSKRQPMNSLVLSSLGSAQTPKVINLMYKNKIGENQYTASRVFFLHANNKVS